MTKTSSRFVAVPLFLLLTVPVSFRAFAWQDNPAKDRALLPESIARKSAITKIMPLYPEQAVESGISGTVHIILEISPEGEVLRIKVKPRTNVLLANAVADAVNQWSFRPRPGQDGLSKGVLTRLIFRFSLNEGQPQVELYSPKPDTRTDECLGCTNSAKEMRQWRDW